MTTHSRILAWEIQEPGGLLSMDPKSQTQLRD